MEINKAKELVYGKQVHCPADRGDPAYMGVVRHVSTDVNKNIHGVEYVWVTVSKVGNGQTSHVWPSNRLS